MSKAHKPVPIVAKWSIHSWEMCTVCDEVRRKHAPWKKQQCPGPVKKASRYMGE